MPIGSSASVSAIHLSLGRIIDSEFFKARALPSTWWCAAVTVVLAILAGMLAAAVLPAEGVGDFWAVDVQVLSLLAMALPGLAGCLLGSVEYSSGAIRSSLSAVPQRGLWLAGKTVAVIMVLALTMIVSVLLNAGASALVLASRGLAISFDGLDLKMMVMLIVAAAMVGLLSFGFAILTRSAAASLAIGFGMVMILPMICQMIPPLTDLLPYLPMIAITAMTSPFDGDPTLFLTSRAGGSLVMVIWVLLVMGAAAVTLKRRDA